MSSPPILIIDDDPSTRDLVVAVLTAADFEVLTAPDGRAGLAVAQAAQPALILLDMMMPGMDGITTCEYLKEDPQTREIPVVGMTGSDDLKLTERAFRAGAELFLPKPFDAGNLLHLIDLVLTPTQRETPTADRRRHRRLAVWIPARCHVGDPEETSRELAGHLGNLGLGGVLLWLHEMLEPETLIRLTLLLPEGEITAEGSVIWEDPVPRGSRWFRHGIRLLGFLDEAGLLRYKRLLTRVAAGHPLASQEPPETD
jgi:CheY-like chemotaxis protein